MERRKRHARSVSALMRRQFVTVPADESVDVALQIMRFARLRHLLVESDGILVGVLSYRDLQDRALAAARETLPPRALGALAVARAMVDSPYTVRADASLAEAAQRMCRLQVGCLPVVEAAPDGPRLVGLVTESDLLDAAYRPRKTRG